MLMIITFPAYALMEKDNSLCPNSNTTLEIKDCIAKHFDSLEQKRTELETAELKHAQIIEADYNKMGSVQYQGLAEQTQKSREAFEAYRQRECERVRASYGAGSAAGIGFLGCKSTLTEQRIEQLSNE